MTMKGFFCALMGLAIASSAIAQTYPSPTYNNVTVNGDLAVGTTTPTAKLDVNGSATINGKANIGARIGPHVASDLLLGSTNGNAPFVASQGGYPLSFWTNATERLTIAADGQVYSSGRLYANGGLTTPWVSGVWTGNVGTTVGNYTNLMDFSGLAEGGGNTDRLQMQVTKTSTGTGWDGRVMSIRRFVDATNVAELKFGDYVGCNSSFSLAFSISGTTSACAYDTSWNFLKAPYYNSKRLTTEDSVGYINPIDYGATCNGTTDDSTAIATAEAQAFSRGFNVRITCYMAVASDVTLRNPVEFTAAGRLIIASGKTATFNAEIKASSDWQQIFAGSGSATITNAGGKISACWWGACSGASDVAANIRAMFVSASNKQIVFPPTTYNLCTAIPVGTGAGTVGYPVTNQSSVVIDSKSQWSVTATGATFTTCAAIAQNIAFLISKSTDWKWDGGIFVGSRSGLAASTVNAPFQLMNNQRFNLKNARAASGYYGNGAFFEGDGNTDFVIENNVGDDVSMGVDMAFSRNGVYRNNTFKSATNVGNKCLSHIYDGPMISYITTGTTPNAENVTFQGNRCDNYITGAAISNGKHFKIIDNFFNGLPGSGTTPGTGIYIYYQNGGDFTSVGNPVWDMTIEGNHMDGIGSSVAGCGVSIGAASISNTDAINDLFIQGNSFAGPSGSVGVCADTTAGAKLANFWVGVNAWRNLGAMLNSNASSIAKPSGLPR